MPSASSRLRWIWAFTFGVIVGLVIFWSWAFSFSGGLRARFDHANDHHEIKLYGSPRDSFWDKNELEYYRLLEERYGVEPNWVAGCLITKEFRWYCDGYNAVTKQLLSEKHGKDIFLECARLAGFGEDDEPAEE